ncbi:MAG: tyrosine-type recombinase/integrase [Chitinophagaceae bacterium]
MDFPKKNKYDFLRHFEKFITASTNGKRLQPDGKRISAATIRNYQNTLRLLGRFTSEKNFELRLRREVCLSSKEFEMEQKYWKKFYRKFSDFLYDDLGCFDNYAGQNMKIIKTFFTYLNRETAIRPGEFHKFLYIRKEDVKIFPILPEELNFFIFDKDFEISLSKRMKEVKDVFVFGCTVALRVSDLLSLIKTDLKIVNRQYYLAVRAQKTRKDTLIKLPQYCIDIVVKYSNNKKYLLPPFNKSNLNNYIKRLLEKAGMNQEVRIIREKRGMPFELKNPHLKSKTFRICDVATTHTMRRTAITMMLCLGMPEQLVRMISGHSPGTKEFYRYVLWAQAYQNKELDKVFEKLEICNLPPLELGPQ